MRSANIQVNRQALSPKEAGPIGSNQSKSFSLRLDNNRRDYLKKYAFKIASEHNRGSSLRKIRCE